MIQIPFRPAEPIGQCVEIESDDGRARGYDGHARYHYRGYEFDVEKRDRKWWCFQGIRRPAEEWESGVSPWSLISIVRDDGWASRKRERIVRKLARSVDEDIMAKESRR